MGRKKRARKAAEAAAEAAAGDARPVHAPDATETASKLHAAALHLLRRVERDDAGSGLSSARLSALSMLVYGGPRTVGQLATAEHVSPPTMTRLVTGMEREGLVSRSPDARDGRLTRITATPEGERMLREGRELRVRGLAEALASIPAPDLARLGEAAVVLERALDARDRGT